MEYFVYILTNERNSVLYTGVTNDLKRRVWEHKNEINEGFSKKYHLHKLVYFERYTDALAAIEREKLLKKWSRNKKEKLIETKNVAWRDLAENFF